MLEGTCWSIKPAGVVLLVLCVLCQMSENINIVTMEVKVLSYVFPLTDFSNIHSPAISSVPNLMLSAAGDSEAEGFKGWLYLDC